MSSYIHNTSDHSDKKDALEASRDLFNESLDFTRLSLKNSTCSFKTSYGNHRETSGDLSFRSQREPKMSLNNSNNVSNCCNKSIVSSGQNASMDSSKHFIPVFPINNLCESNSNSSFEDKSISELMNLGVQNVSTRNIINLISESDNSESSILGDSFISDEDNQESIKSFTTPVCKSAKKHKIRQWLDNVAYNSTQGTLATPVSKEAMDGHQGWTSQKHSFISSNGHIPGTSVVSQISHQVPEFEVVNCIKDTSLHSGLENSSFYCSKSNVETCRKSSNENIRKPSSLKISEKFEDYDIQNSLGCMTVKPLLTQHNSSQNCKKYAEFIVNCDISILKIYRDSNASNIDSNCFKLNESHHTLEESDPVLNGVFDKNQSKTDLDDSFFTFRFSKKKNYLNISSDDSEAKDTANESEEIDDNHDTINPYTPGRRFYFRNSLNNSLDDDAKPFICNVNRGTQNKFINKDNEHDNTSGRVSEELVPKHSNDKLFQLNKSNHICHEVLSNYNENMNDVSQTQRSISKNILNCKSENSSIDVTNIDCHTVFRSTLLSNLNAEDPVSTSSPKLKLTSINLDDSAQNEYDKYIYRTRSDSSIGSQENLNTPNSTSDDVISINSTSDDKEESDNSPFFDLEHYLKKNVHTSTKSSEFSFLKNNDIRRKARIEKIVLPTHSSCSHHTAFLLSLTPQIPNGTCHPEAIKYRGNSFSKYKNELVDLLFKLFNREIFDDELPPIEIKWSGQLTTTSGITRSTSKIIENTKVRNSMIKLSKTIIDNAAKLRDVLLHELCHVATWLIDEQSGGHGPLFKKWVNKIWMKFPDIPKVKTTHNYELKWKYLYKCSYCGNEIGKMKLSDKNSCSLCGGLVFINP